MSDEMEQKHGKPWSDDIASVRNEIAGLRASDERQQEAITELRGITEKLATSHQELQDYMKKRFRAQTMMTARQGQKLRREMSSMKDDLQKSIKTNDENAKTRSEELKEDIKNILAGLAASNPVWFTAAVGLAAAVVGIVIGAGVAIGIAHHIL